jgi:hypothetical protein
MSAFFPAPVAESSPNSPTLPVVPLSARSGNTTVAQGGVSRWYYCDTVGEQS